MGHIHDMFCHFFNNDQQHCLFFDYDNCQESRYGVYNDFECFDPEYFCYICQRQGVTCDEFNLSNCIIIDQSPKAISMDKIGPLCREKDNSTLVFLEGQKHYIAVEKLAYKYFNETQKHPYPHGTKKCRFAIVICFRSCLQGGKCIGFNRCQCKPAFTGSDCSKDACDPPCQQGTCTAPKLCNCTESYYGDVCQGFRPKLVNSKRNYTTAIQFCRVNYHSELYIPMTLGEVEKLKMDFPEHTCQPAFLGHRRILDTAWSSTSVPKRSSFDWNIIVPSPITSPEKCVIFNTQHLSIELVDCGWKDYFCYVCQREGILCKEEKLFDCLQIDNRNTNETVQSAFENSCMKPNLIPLFIAGEHEIEVLVNVTYLHRKIDPECLWYVIDGRNEYSYETHEEAAIKFLPKINPWLPQLNIGEQPNCIGFSAHTKEFVRMSCSEYRCFICGKSLYHPKPHTI